MRHQVEEIMGNFRTYSEDTKIRKRSFLKKNRGMFISLMFDFEQLARDTVEGQRKVEVRSPEQFDEIRTRFLTDLGLISFLSLGGAVALSLAFRTFLTRSISVLADNTARIAVGQPLVSSSLTPVEADLANQRLIEAAARLREHRQRELAIINNSADVACSLNEQLKFVTVSESCEQRWRLSQNELIGRSLLTLVPESTKVQIRTQFERIADSETANGKFETTMALGQQSTRSLAWSVRWSSSDKLFFALARDVTARKELEAIKQRFVSIVSHDLRTPLSSLNSSLSLMIDGKKGPVNEKTYKILDNMKQSVHLLRALADDILELQKLDSGTFALNLENVRAYNICAAAIDHLQGMAAQAGITIRPPEQDAEILADERRLVQVLNNLLSNAIKYSKRGSTVRVDVAVLGTDVEISVTDQGAGIKKEQIELIFQKFVQGESRTDFAMKSTGIGLAVVKTVVEAHGGTVGCSSEPGKGSRFWLRLKRSEDDLEDDLGDDTEDVENDELADLDASGIQTIKGDDRS